MQEQDNRGHDGAPALWLIASPDAPGGHGRTGERDVLADLADDLDRGIGRLPLDSLWRHELAGFSRAFRAAASLGAIRLVR